MLYACQSDDPLRGTAVLSFMRRGFEVRGPLRPHRGEAATVPVFDLANAVRTECEHARQFMRFSRSADGVYRARFEPRANVVPLVMGHFAARFGSQPFLIHDPVHHVAGLWDGRTVELAATGGAEARSAYGGKEPIAGAAGLARHAEPGDERTYRALWKRFYDSVAVEERANPELRRHFMPKRFWKNLPEMAPDGWDGPAAPAGCPPQGTG